MPLYLVEEYIPGMSEQELLLSRQRLRRAVAELAACGECIRYVATTFVPDQETSFSQFEAGSRALVETACSRAGVRSARISEARAVASSEKEGA
jgi:hypothetical protein